MFPFEMSQIFAKADYPRLRKLGSHLVNWTTWFRLATYDTFADDNGDESKAANAGFFVGTIIGLFGYVFVAYWTFNTDWRVIACMSLVLYMAIGRIYLLYNKNRGWE